MWISTVTVVVLLIVVGCHLAVVWNASGRTYDSVSDIPHNRVGLLLATSPITPGGAHNFYFENRIKSANELYKAGKVDYIIASGGDYTQNQKNGCDEPKSIRDSLVACGVPADKIILDYEGTRTLNSIAKAKEVYRLDSVTIISQKYHNERAIYLADKYDMHAIGINAGPSPIRRNRIKNTLREVLARVKLFIDVVRGLHPDIKESIVRDFTKLDSDVLSVSHIRTEYYDLICLKPEMSGLKMDMVCGEIPSPENDSIVLAFAGAFTGTEFDKGHVNVAGDHVAGGTRFKGYRCKRNTGAFTWSAKSGSIFFYKDYSSALDKAAKEGGMGFAQEMMIHDGANVPTTRPLGNKNVFRALCLDSDNHLALYESQGIVTFGNFIDALLSQGVKEALYTDMGQGWNYCFYRMNQSDKALNYLHSTSLPYASNIIVIKTK